MIKTSNNKNSSNIFLNEYFNIIVIIVVVLIFALAYVFLIGPKLKSTKAVIIENIETQKKLYAEQEKKMNELKIISDVYEKISPADIKKFNSVLPEPYIKEQLFGELEEIIVNGGYLINSVAIVSEEEEGETNVAEEMPTIGSVEKSERLGEIVITVSVGAIDYSGFKNLLRTIEANSRLFDIQKVDFSEGNNAATLELATYFYKS